MKAALPGLTAYEALIRHWLGMEPASDADGFEHQAAQALWLEERYYTHWIEILKKVTG